MSKIRIDALLVILDHYFGGTPFKISSSLLHGGKAFWVQDVSGQNTSIMYDLGIDGVQSLSPYVSELIECVKVGKGSEYKKFVEKNEEFIARVPLKNWFIQTDRHIWTDSSST